MCKRLAHSISSVLLLCLAAGVTNADLVAYWSLDEGAGTTVGDYTGAWDGTITGDVAWVQGHQGTALEFPGGQNYVNCGNVDIGPSLTVAYWCFNPQKAYERPIGQHSGDYTTDRGWAVLSRNEDEGGVWFRVNGADDAWNGGDIVISDNLTKTEWFHLAFTFDGVTRELKGYLNGEEKASAICEAGRSIYPNANDLRLGNVGTGEVFSGMLDEVAIWNEPLTADEIQMVMLGHVGGPQPLAFGPQPKDGALLEQTAAVLRWKPGDFAASHEVYFGESFEAVRAATPDDADLFVGTMAATMLPVGATDPLVPGRTYYWRVDEINDAEPDSPWKGNVWSFRVRPTEAWDPFPVDAMRNVDPNQDLTWDTGLGAIFHTVYFSKNFDEVNNATIAGMPGTNPTYEPGTLDLDTTYYWRVDEFAYPASKTYPGEVWSFTTRGEGGGVKAEYFGGMALAGDPILSRIEPAIDHLWGEGEVAGGLLELVSARWKANLEAPFTETYRLITTTDDGVRLWLDGRLVIDNWTDHGTTDDIATVDLVAGQYYMIEMEWYENGGGAVAQLSWQNDTLPRQIIPQGWLQLPLRATSPSPAHLNPHADQASILTWTGGDDATGHDVYFGDDAAAVAGADTTTTGIYRGRQAVAATSFNPGPLEWGKTYYWRVDEVNPDGVLTGAVWTFTAADFLVVEDFEGYTDNNLEYEAIFQTWIDGFGYTEPEDVMGNGTGSTVGNLEPPFAEQTIVHSGFQSMPLDYNNVIAPYYSETERTWSTAQDWTVNGMDTLTLYFRGRPANGPDTLYVALQDSSNNTRAVSRTDPGAVNVTDWTEWQIPMSQFTGVNATRIKKMFIGVGNRSAPTPGGAGTLYIDDIRVTQAATP